MLQDMKVSDLMQLIDILKGNNNSQFCPWEIGKSYFIRTVTMHLIGKLKIVSDKEMVLTDASWIADSGRFHNALKSGSLDEIEPFVDDVIINRDSIIDATLWKHLLPNEQK